MAPILVWSKKLKFKLETRAPSQCVRPVNSIIQANFELPIINWIITILQLYTQWRREVGAAAPGDTFSRGDTKRKKLTNFVGKMVKNCFGVKWLKKGMWKILCDNLQFQTNFGGLGHYRPG